ncbi:MAG: hypothetical protein ACXV9R_01615 [Methylobacter sp.]
MYTEGIAIVTVVLFVAIWIAGVIAWGYAAVYMFKTMVNYHPGREWGKFLPISLFMPWFFTAEGNKYRVNLLKSSGVFIVLVLSGFGVDFLNESLRPQQELNNEVEKEDNGTSNSALKRDAQKAARPSATR